MWRTNRSSCVSRESAPPPLLLASKQASPHLFPCTSACKRTLRRAVGAIVLPIILYQTWPTYSNNNCLSPDSLPRQDDDHSSKCSRLGMLSTIVAPNNICRRPIDLLSSPPRLPSSQVSYETASSWRSCRQITALSMSHLVLRNEYVRCMPSVSRPTWKAPSCLLALVPRHCWLSSAAF